MFDFSCPTCGSQMPPQLVACPNPSCLDPRRMLRRLTAKEWNGVGAPVEYIRDPIERVRIADALRLLLKYNILQKFNVAWIASNIELSRCHAETVKSHMTYDAVRSIAEAIHEHVLFTESDVPETRQTRFESNLIIARKF